MKSKMTDKEVDEKKNRIKSQKTDWEQTEEQFLTIESKWKKQVGKILKEDSIRQIKCIDQ